MSEPTVRVLRPRPNPGVGQPFYMRLNQWGLLLYHAFDARAYLVGSSAVSKKWRDVDVRLILADEAFDALFGTKTRACETQGRWSAMCTAFAVWGREFTGLPIDFQFQRRSDANRLYPHQVRWALGILDHWDEVPGE